ncbi:MAG: hypothetical protein JNM84_17185 [Planctomycetes bacterium]|nr:hypothetical protein [Planctomycetota bacterium]
MLVKTLGLIAALGAAGVIGWVGLRANAPAESPRAVAEELRPAPVASGALVLSLEIDHTGVRVLQALAKPGLLVRPARDPWSLPFRWTLTSPTGALLAENAFDPGPVDLDPAHAGEPPLVRGDTITPRLLHANVKVSDFRAAGAVLRFERRDGARWIACGEHSLDRLTVR